MGRKIAAPGLIGLTRTVFLCAVPFFLECRVVNAVCNCGVSIRLVIPSVGEGARSWRGDSGVQDDLKERVDSEKAAYRGTNNKC